MRGNVTKEVRGHAYRVDLTPLASCEYVVAG